MSEGNRPYCALMSRRPSHGLDLGILNILPTMGRPLGLGGRGLPSAQDLKNRYARRYLMTSPTKSATESIASVGPLETLLKRCTRFMFEGILADLGVGVERSASYRSSLRRIKSEWL